MAYLIGALRDGYLDKKQYLISIGQMDRAWLEYLQKLVKENFGVNSKIRALNNNAFELRIFSKKLFTEISEMGVVDSRTMPTAILQTKELWNPYVNGFFDAEGHCTSQATFRKTGKKKISFHQNDKASLEFIKYVLEEYGIKTSAIYLQKNRKCYALYVQNKDGIRKFAATFSPVRKKEQLNNLLLVLPP